MPYVVSSYVDSNGPPIVTSSEITYDCSTICATQDNSFMALLLQHDHYTPILGIEFRHLCAMNKQHWPLHPVWHAELLSMQNTHTHMDYTNFIHAEE